MPDIDRIAELVNDSLFEYPDYDKIAKDVCSMDSPKASKTEDELRKIADEMYEEDKFDIDEYKGWEKSVEYRSTFDCESLFDII